MQHPPGEPNEAMGHRVPDRRIVPALGAEEGLWQNHSDVDEAWIQRKPWPAETVSSIAKLYCFCYRGDRGGGSWTGGVERTRWCRALAPRYRHLTMWVSAADPGVSQFLHRSNGDIVVDAIGFVVRATLKEHTGSPVVGTFGVHRGRGTRPRDGRTGVSGTIRTAVKPPRKDPVSTGRAARRLRSGRKPCMGL